MPLLRILDAAADEAAEAAAWYERHQAGLGSDFSRALVVQKSRDEIVVIAIAHEARRPGYWRNR